MHQGHRDSQPLVTVALPTFKRPAFVRAALGSVLAQDYPALDVLVSDNGSADETQAVLAGFADPRLRMRANEVTVPALVHLNQCLAEAKGDYFVLVSDDDTISPSFVGCLVAAFTAEPSATVALPSSAIMDGEDKIIRHRPTPDWRKLNGLEFLLDWLLRRRPLPIATFLTFLGRTGALREMGGFPHFAKVIQLHLKWVKRE